MRIITRTSRRAVMACPLTSGRVAFGVTAVDTAGAASSVQPGSVSCLTASGKITFSPALKAAVSNTTVMEKFSLTLKGCTATKSGAAIIGAHPHAAGDGIGAVSVGLKKRARGCPVCLGRDPTPPYGDESVDQVAALLCVHNR